MSLKHRSIVFLLALGFLLGPAGPAGAINLYFKTSPLPERLRPFSEAATLSLLATAADGKPLTEAWAHVRLAAPQRGSFFSTDYPLVEGAELLELRFPLKAGKAEWKYVFPIRGEYRMRVEVFAPDGSTASETFEISIREHRIKWLTLGIFTLALFLAGFVAGRIFTRRPAVTVGALMAPAAYAVLLGGATAALPAASGGAGAGLDIGAAAVGEPVHVHWRLEPDAADGKNAAVLSLAVTHVEKGITVFAFDRLVTEGEYSMKFHFVDGAEHRVTAVAELPSGKSIRTQKLVEVAASEPPATASFPSLGLFLAAVVAGLGAGRWSRS